MSEYIVDIADNPSFGGVLITCGEIVRCRDCVYFDPNDELSEVYPDRYWCDLMAQYLQADGFCAWAERKEDGE